jgi:hypothetical protein
MASLTAARRLLYDSAVTPPPRQSDPLSLTPASVTPNTQTSPLSVPAAATGTLTPSGLAWLNREHRRACVRLEESQEREALQSRVIRSCCEMMQPLLGGEMGTLESMVEALVARHSQSTDSRMEASQRETANAVLRLQTLSETQLALVCIFCSTMKK